MTVRNLANLDRTVFQPLGRILQEAFADGFISTGTMAITKSFSEATGTKRLLDMTATYDGANNCYGGAFKFETIIDANVDHIVHGLSTSLTLTDNAGFWPSYADGPCALRVNVSTDVAVTAPDLDGVGINALTIGYYVDESTNPPQWAFPFQFNTDAAKGQWDGLLRMERQECLGVEAAGGDLPTQDNTDKRMPIVIAAQTYWIPLSLEAY